MKASELKPGDWFKFTTLDTFPSPGPFLFTGQDPLLSHPTHSNRTAPQFVTADRSQSWTGSPHITGKWSTTVADVELVPMPGPYVVGKAYRTRGGRKVVFRRRSDSVCPNIFEKEDGYHLTAYDNGWWGIAENQSGDIMGEWTETLTLEAGKRYVRRDGKVTGALIHWDQPIRGLWAEKDQETAADGDARVYHSTGTHYYGDKAIDIVALYTESTSTTPKENPPMSKRTLPTVTLDQIFETLKEKGACWYKDLGPIKLAEKLYTMGGRFCGSRAPSDLRTIHKAVEHGFISVADAGWLINNMGPALTPRDLNATGQTIGTPAFAALLNEWENPKPKPTPKLVRGTDIPLGGLFRRKGIPGEVFVRIQHESGSATAVRFIWIKGPGETERLGGTDGVAANDTYVLMRHVGSSGSHEYEDIME